MSTELSEAQLARIGTRMLNDEFNHMHNEVLKLRKLLAKHLCDCHKTFVLPLDPNKHKHACSYRKSMED